MLRVIDRRDGILLQKVSTPDGKLIRFQLVHENALGDASQVKPFTTLSAARQAGGVTAFLFLSAIEAFNQ